MSGSVDVIVIGAGVVGAAVAQQASSAGLRVALLERGRPGQQGSGRTAGNLHIQTIHTRRPGQRVPVDVRRLLPLQRAARERWETWEEEIGPVGLRRCGGLMVAETPEQVQDLHRKAEWEGEIGIPTEVLDGPAAHQVLPLFGPGVAAATWCAWDGFADPALVTPALVRAAVRAGTQLSVGSAVRAVQPTGDGWQVSTGTEEWEAGAVVNAAGPWMGEISRLAGAEVAINPQSIQMHALSAGVIRLPFLIAHVGEGMSVKQTKADGMMVGGGWPAGPFTPSGAADINPASTAGNLDQVRRILPAVGARPVERVWTGPLAASPDEMPVVGAVPGPPGMFVVGGTYSFTFAPLWGDLVTAMILGEAPALDVGDLGPARLLVDPPGSAPEFSGERTEYRKEARNF